MAEKNPPLAAIVGTHQDQTSATPITDFIFLSGDVSNAYLVNTADGHVLVNAGTSPGGSRHRTLFAKVASGPRQYIILTQSHPDHFGGVQALKDAQTKVITQSRYRDTRAYYASIAPCADPRTFKLWEPLLGKMGGISKFEEVTPDIEFDDHHSFELGGRRFDLYATPGGETLDSLIVHLPDDDIVFTGNLFGPAWMSVPNLYTLRGDKTRSALQYLRSLERVKALKPRMIITGHGEPVAGRDHIQDCLGRMYRATRHVHDKTVDGMNAGKDLYSLMREIRLPEGLGVAQLHGKVSWNVRAIWSEYIGWFEYRSTTELYDVPPHAMAGELFALCGGAAPLVRRAEALLMDSKPLNALHLIEIVLAAEPVHRGAWQLKKRIHEALLERCGGENMSETMWLKSEILAAERALNR